MSGNIINYTPPPTIDEFVRDHKPGAMFYDWIVGPVGSGKTTGIFFKLVYMASLQAPGPDGIRRTRAVIVRNTMPQLKDTTLTSWNYWFKDGQAGVWRASDNKFILRFGDVECEVLFRPLDTPDDVARVLSLEVTFAIIDEFVQIPRQIIDALSARCGRYPAAKDGKATNWGMWGSSNPDTEDNWWYDYLHGELPDNVRYFKQPSGLAPDAENVENLPGGVQYYVDQSKGKKEEWIKQFIEAEWGFSISGKAVVPTFKADIHVAKKPLIYNPLLKLVIGLDPGLAGSALIFGQEDLNGRLCVLGELVQEGYGAERLITERLMPYLKRRFPGADVVIAPDPAAANRSQSDEKSVVDKFKKHFPIKIETNNRLPIRLDAIEHYTSRLTAAGPALLLDPNECPVLTRALKGGWRYVMDSKRDTLKSPEPEKNQYSHPGDAFGYLCRYFQRQEERIARADKNKQVRVVRPTNTYHFR
jgi:hypothetical protein